MRWWTLDEVAEAWGKRGRAPTRRTLERWCAQGKLPASKRFGKRWQVDMFAMKGLGLEGREVYEDLVESVNGFCF